MKRRDFISLAVVSAAAAVGANAHTRRAPVLKIAFVGGTFFSKLKSGAYVAVQPNGKNQLAKHRAFMIGPKGLILKSAGALILPESYPLSVMHPELGQAKDHTVYCLVQTDVVAGSRGTTDLLASGVANYKDRLKDWETPSGAWHNVTSKMPDILNTRFHLRGGQIVNGAAVNLTCAKEKWKHAGASVLGDTLSDVAVFETSDRALWVEGKLIELPNEDVTIYVFGGPTEGSQPRKKGDPNDKVHHPMVLADLYDIKDNDPLYLETAAPLKVEYVLSITHPCDAGRRSEGAEKARTTEADRLIPPDTEFCVNEEGPAEP